MTTNDLRKLIREELIREMSEETATPYEEGDTVLITFKADTQLETYEDAEFDGPRFTHGEPSIDNFKAGEQEVVDIIGLPDDEDNEFIQIQFGDGSVTFVNRNSITIEKTNRSF